MWACKQWACSLGAYNIRGTNLGPSHCVVELGHMDLAQLLGIICSCAYALPQHVAHIASCSCLLLWSLCIARLSQRHLAHEIHAPMHWHIRFGTRTYGVQWRGRLSSGTSALAQRLWSTGTSLQWICRSDSNISVLSSSLTLIHGLAPYVPKCMCSGTLGSDTLALARGGAQLASAIYAPA